MQRRTILTVIVVAVFVLTILSVLVTSISSFAAQGSPSSPSAADSQELTPAATEVDASVAGSTDGIVWMGIVIALIVLLPLLVNRAVWSRRS